MDIAKKSAKINQIVSFVHNIILDKAYYYSYTVYTIV